MTAKDNTPAGDPGQTALVSVFNRGTNIYTHEQYALRPGTFLDVPEDVAEKWLSIVEHGINVVVPASTMTSAGPAAAAANAKLAADATAANLAAQVATAKAADLQAQLDAANAKLEAANALLEQSTAPGAPAPDAAQ